MKAYSADAFAPEVDRRARPVAQLQVSGHEVGVQVRQHTCSIVQAVLLRELQVLIDVALRIHHRGRARSLVADQVRGVREALQIELLEQHQPSEDSSRTTSAS